MSSWSCTPHEEASTKATGSPALPGSRRTPPCGLRRRAEFGLHRPKVVLAPLPRPEDRKGRVSAAGPPRQPSLEAGCEHKPLWRRACWRGTATLREGRSPPELRSVGKRCAVPVVLVGRETAAIGSAHGMRDQAWCPGRPKAPRASHRCVQLNPMFGLCGVGPKTDARLDALALLG